jgi:O-methyltransferase involved in polyketide biosynthesis
MYESLRLPMAASDMLGRGTLERYLLARHQAIDKLLERAIESDGVSLVIEAAAGLSPRGWRFTERYGELVYIEGDLPGMVERKREALERMGSLTERHRVVELDVLRSRGAASLGNVVRGLDHRAGLAIITEGLLSYLPRDAVDNAWGRFARNLSRFATGRYISDMQLSEGVTPEARAFRVLLAAFVRGDVHLHFRRAEDVRAALLKAGFRSASVRPATEVLGVKRSEPSRTHILEASTK